MGLLIVVILAYVAEIIWSPRLDWIDEEKMLIVHYDKANTRSYLVIVKF